MREWKMQDYKLRHDMAGHWLDQWRLLLKGKGNKLCYAILQPLLLLLRLGIKLKPPCRGRSGSSE